MKISLLAGVVGALFGLLALPASSVFAGQVKVTLKGHTHTITSLAFAPDGKTFASGSKDGTVILWDLATGKARATLPGHKDMVTAIAFTPDSKTLASASHASDIYLWDVATGKRIALLSGHAKDVRGLDFSPDGKTLASGGVDKTVRLWTWEDGKAVKILTGHTAEVNCVRFAPDGKTLASGGWDRQILLWEPDTGKSRATLQGHQDFIRDLVFTSDSKILVSSGKDGPIRLWDVKVGKLKTTWEEHQGLVRALALTLDDKLLASAGRDGTLNLWDFAAGKVRASMQEGVLGFQTVAFSPDGKTLATGGIDRNVSLWDVAEILQQKPAKNAGKAKEAGAAIPEAQGTGAGGTVYKFVNKTGGKFTDEQCFWSLNNGKDWHSFAAKPTAPCTGNGRVYFCVGKKPKNFDDFSAYWDFIEYNYAKGTWYGNTTQVDAFCIPMTIELGAKKVGIAESRSKLFEAFRKECPKEFKDCVKGDLWILSPHRAGFGKNGPHAKYFDKYVDEVWEMYAQEKKTPSGKFTGKVVNGALTFTPAEGGPKAKAYTCARKPTTQEILLGTGVLGTNPHFCAAFNRHVAADPADWTNPKKFYQTEPCNWYSKFLHEHSIDHKAYGFCYDDASDQAAYFAGKAPEVIVTLYWDTPAEKK